MSELTHVERVWVKNRIENRIRFGQIAEQHIIDRQRRVVSFTAGSIFAFVRWTSNDYGTVVSRIDILRAVAPGERYATGPDVRPGGESLLRISGWPKVEKVLQAIDAIEALGDHDAPKSGTALRLERLRKRADRALSRAAGASPDRHSSCGCVPARTACDLPRRRRLPSPGRAAHQAHSRTSRADHLPHRPHHRGRWNRHGLGT